MNKAKIIFTIAVLAMPFFVRAQSIDIGRCGSWEPDSVKITEWETVDTLKKPVLTQDREWVESGVWLYDNPNVSYAVYSPCGTGQPSIQYMFRVCKITGIRQKRYRIWTYHYAPAEISDYQKAINKFSEK